MSSGDDYEEDNSNTGSRDPNASSHEATSTSSGSMQPVFGRNPPAPDAASLMNYQFTFQSRIDDATLASFRIDADPHPSDSNGFQSVSQSVSDFRLENGRTYHRYSDGSYMFPNDPQETDREEWQYTCLELLMNRQSYFAPWSQRNPPRKVLDIATGTGHWAMDMGDEFPTATISGTDLSPIQPVDVPPNVYFTVEDSREPWDWYAEGELFDYIHIRMTLGCWQDFGDDIVKKAFNQLEPGGWFEAQELDSTIYCDDDSMAPDYPLKVHMDDLNEATAAYGRPLNIVNTYKQAMKDAGFADLTEYIYKIPVNGWPREREWKTLGKMWQKNFLDGISAFSLGPLHRVRGLKRDEIEILLMDVRNAISDQSVHAYQKFYIYTARKPHPDEMRDDETYGSTNDDA